MSGSPIIRYTRCILTRREKCRTYNTIKPTLHHDRTHMPFDPISWFSSRLYLLSLSPSPPPFSYPLSLLISPMTDREMIFRENSPARKGPSSRIVPSNKPPLYLPSQSIYFDRSTPPLPPLFSFSIPRYVIRKTRDLLVQEIARPWPLTAIPQSPA